MVIYGTLGGIRAIAWTDVIQGTVLFVGFILLMFLMMHEFGISAATNTISNSQNAVKLMRPDSLMMREWLSYILLVGIGGALYPQAIQRIYSARSTNTLKRSFAAMAFMPFISVLISIIVGIYALAYIPGLEGADSDQAFASILRVIQESSLVGYTSGHDLQCCASCAYVHRRFSNVIYFLYVYERYLPGAHQARCKRIRIDSFR